MFGGNSFNTPNKPSQQPLFGGALTSTPTTGAAPASQSSLFGFGTPQTPASSQQQQAFGQPAAQQAQTGAGTFGAGAATTGGTAPGVFTFSLGKTATTAAPSGSGLFGTGSTTTAPGGGLFGATAPAVTTASTGFSFGQPSAPATTTASASTAFTFGAAASSTGSGLFGPKQPAGQAAASGGAFGAPASATTTAGLGGALFQKPATAVAPSAFGQPAAPGSTTAPGLFGKTATTTAAPGAGGIFGTGAPAASGAPAAGSAIFGTNTQASTTATTGNLFNNPASTATTTAGGLPTSASSALFGIGQSGKPAAPAAVAPAQPAAGGLFNIKPASTTAAPAAVGLFGTGVSTSQSGNPFPKTTTTAAPSTLGFNVGSGATAGVVSTANPSTQTQPATAGINLVPASTTLNLGGQAAIQVIGTPQSGLAINKPAGATAPLGVGASTSVAVPTSTSTATSIAGRQTFRDLEGLLNRLVIDFEQQDNRFQELLEEVNAQDIVVFDRQQKIDNYVKEIEALNKDLFRFSTHVEMLEEQQNEARQVIEALEKSLNLQAFNDSNQPGPTSNLAVDVRRHQILQLLMETDIATKQLDNEIDDASQQLIAVRQLMESMNNDDKENANIIDQIQTILKTQMSSIMSLETECEEISRLVSNVASARAM